ncbi:hypothetical protein MO973_41120 [Paenibacillus sp. TRM 82003]|uniref:hypothetical protein n=1 Tax=Kineococcus sp. TRM81007 TaxID=2925831 RepID=UPI001F57CBFB|nr:hypothetical protein [Kineococcus sp. TRM81007]MCI2237008.1 hypothetical protein [Kineococcus sp. TRM81007]MCI3926597.1 hypothetical protein [Paenibacillus sp. TRM 82003]
MRRWDPVQEQGTRHQRRIAAAGAPEPSTAHVPGFEHYPRFYAKRRRGRVVDVAVSFDALVRSARGGWAAGTAVTATHRAPDGHPVVLDADDGETTAATGATCGSSRWVPEVPGGPVAEVVAAVRTLRALGAAPGPGVQEGLVDGSVAERSQRAWLDGDARAGVDGFRVECPRPAGHDGLCEARSQLGDLVWRWDRREQTVHD